jgi:CelD/BcsL family acetyltransferase involved in cellulose biosynthesis
MSGPVRVIDPLTDDRWVELVERHPQASVFHTRGWLDSLRRTYGYEPYVLTTTANRPLRDGLVVCRVKTWLARRLVSLPFTDHCDPLVDDPEGAAALATRLRDDVVHGGWRSAEVRSRGEVLGGFSAGASYCLHAVDLTAPSEQVFRRFHPSSTQRAIRRAEREGLQYETGVSESLLTRFYGLLRLTRRRHGLPPQPFTWFRNLAGCLGNALTIHLASKDGASVAGLLTLSYRKTMVYKYGGSDATQHRLGGMPFLFWRAIQDAQARGIEELDLGRSDLDQPGLIAFKEHLGARRRSLTYSQIPESRRGSSGEAGSTLGKAARRVVSHLPDPLLDLTGRLIYRHLG